MRASVLAPLIALSCFACRPSQTTPTKTDLRDAGALPSSTGSAPLPATAASSRLLTPTAPAASACGALGCLAFEAPVDAFRFVLAHAPRVLAIGEAHAQRANEGTGVASSTKRFTETLLPELAGKSPGLVLELWLGEPKCGKVVEVVREQQKPVTQGQAKTNPNELIALGDRAFALGIRPFPLKPSCDDYAPIADAGEDAVLRMLELIERLSEERLKALLRAPGDGGPPGDGGVVVAYGGALHNDVSPAPGKEGFSFGPAMVHATDGRYVELDLIVGDFVRDGEPWTSLPWTKTYLAAPPTAKTLLYRTGPMSFVMIFPRAAKDAGAKSP